ncbi:MAG: RsmF rRNA methyltransferase first C-terminal domain-containing protein, partial [Erysipelotrichaceae bacterium]
DKDFKLIVDLCAAPGGKSINALNTFNDCLLIANDVTYARASIISSNFERCGFTNTLVSSTDISNLSASLKGNVELVILDVPCSGEGMIRKYPEIINNLKDEEYHKLEKIQSKLLDEAYLMLSKDGYLVYSTCTYNPGEDEDQLIDFINRYPDMELISIDYKHNSSKLKGTVKLSPLNGTEGQYISILKKNSENESVKLKYLKTVKNTIVEKFIKDNLLLKDYYLYAKDNNYYLSLKPMPEVKGTIRAGLYIGELKKDRFEPSHMLYRCNELKDLFRYRYELNDEEYRTYKKGQELETELKDNYYLLTYKGHSFAYGRAKKGIMKNKYPKGLREMV